MSEVLLWPWSAGDSRVNTAGGWDWWWGSRAGDLRPKRESADSLEKWIFSTASWKSPKNCSYREWQQKWVMWVPSQELMTLKQTLCSAEPLGLEEEMVIWVCLSDRTILLGFWLSGDLPRLSRVGDCSRKSLSPTAFVSPPSKLLDSSNLAYGEFCCLSLPSFSYMLMKPFCCPSVSISPVNNLKVRHLRKKKSTLSASKWTSLLEALVKC